MKSGKQLTKGPILSKYIRAYDHIPRMTEEELEYFGQEKERIRAMFEEMTDQELDPTQVRNKKIFLLIVLSLRNRYVIRIKT